MMTSFRELTVYQRAYKCSLEIHRLSMEFPPFEQRELGSQIRRATKSIAMNIAEGYGKKSSLADFKRFMTMALGSNDEVRVQLEYCRDLGYISEEQYGFYEQEHIEIGKMLSAMLKNWRIIE